MPLYKTVFSLCRDGVGKYRLTWLNKRFQCSKKVQSSCIADRFELLIVGNVNMRAQIVSCKAQTDN
jgi:hypothetical protein